MHVPKAKDWHISIDKYLRPYIPRNSLHKLPRPVSHFLGHRDRAGTEIGNVLVAAWALLGAFVGVVVIEAAFMTPDIKDHGVPLLIASFGAAAILEFNTIESPLAQPRNAIVGHALSAIVAIGITKLFKLNADFNSIRWLAGALACGAASAVMTVTETVYPPAGATALLAAVDPQVEHLGWYLLPLVLLSTALTLIISLLINNMQRQYPTYWWTPVNVGKGSKEDNIEKAQTNDIENLDTSSSKAVTLTDGTNGNTISVTADTIVVPDGLYVAQEERNMLEILQGRLRDNSAQHWEPLSQV